jgi:heptosyltransferase I
MTPARYERIAVVRLSAFGDVVFALPALGALRAAHPGARITWIVEDRFASVLRLFPDVDEVIELPLRAWSAGLRRPTRAFGVMRDALRAVGSLRAARFDLAVDLQGNLKSGVVTRLTGAPKRVGCARGATGEPNWIFTNERAPRPQGPLHRSDGDLLLLAAAGVPYRYERPTPRWTPEIEAAAETFVADRARRGEASVFVVLHPGTSAPTPHKRWPAARYAELARRLKETRGVATVVTWGKGEEDLARSVVDGAAGAAVMAPDLRSPGELGALLRRAKLVVGGDTGPVHFADLLGVPTIAIFGPTDPRSYYPHGRPDRALYLKVPCSPCRERHCPDRICLDGVTTDAVLAACTTALDEAV